MSGGALAARGVLAARAERARAALAGLVRGAPGLACRTRVLAEGIIRHDLWTHVTRVNGMVASVYQVGAALIDTGFARARPALLDALEGVELAAILLTHHHEDHAGCAGDLVARHRCEVHLREPGRWLTESVAALKPYRLVWWGAPAPYAPRPMPERIDAGDRTLRAVPIPGHSASHTAFLDERTGVAFVGDLYLSTGVAAVPAWEDPYASIASLRRIADLAPTRLLNGHGLDVARPARALRTKAERLEAAAGEVRRLHGAGLPPRAIARRIFPAGHARGRLVELLTGGEFTRLNFVRACLARAPA